MLGPWLNPSVHFLRGFNHVTFADKCLTVQSNTDGAAVTLQTCTGSANQKWTFTGGTVRAFGGKCLDVKDGANKDGTRLQVWGCGPANNANQKWNYNKWDNTLEWYTKGKCMDVVDGQQADGTQVCYLYTHHSTHAAPSRAFMHVTDPSVGMQ